MVRDTSLPRMEGLQGVCEMLDIMAASIVADVEVVREMGKAVS